ncbi:MAG: DUF3656 domain-containing protein [Clostridia bacterium]|nr:DUF3656 domain-containing protein [Clostridia bacterium]
MKPELLCPAGGHEAMVAAVQNGADAVYLGLSAFNARQPAENFASDTLRDSVRYCHDRGVKVYVTLNTLVREDEFDALRRAITEIAEARADAVLVQDIGVADAVRRMVPELPLHASTQMAVHNVSGVRFLAERGYARAVLAREMPLSEIAACANLGIELEVFVHGALCVSGSGQCLFSSLVGGRSSNRGRCAQPCRLSYALNGESSHLLSCRDLCAIHEITALTNAGVASLKIEGRLKRAEYVAVVTQAYRRAIDHPDEPVDMDSLRQIFNRGGFTTGYLNGVEESSLIEPKRPNHCGVKIGISPKNGRVLLERDADARDALLLRQGALETPVQLSGSAGQTVACATAQKGAELFCLTQEAQMVAARASYSKEHRTRTVHAVVRLHPGQNAQMRVYDHAHSIEVVGFPVEKAQGKPAERARVDAQLRKTGNTPYRFDQIDIDLGEGAYCAASQLNQLRRDALEAFSLQREGAPYALHPLSPLEPFELPRQAGVPVRITVQSGDPEVLTEALRMGADSALYAPEDLRLEALTEAAKRLPQAFSLALPMMLPQDSQPQLHAWAQAQGDRIQSTYINNVGHLQSNWNGTQIADFGMNLMNRRAISRAMQLGCDGYVPSLELNVGQLRSLPRPAELIVYGRIPLMHLRHCPLCTARRQTGKHADCRRCDHCAPHERVNAHSLIDRKGAAFPMRRIAYASGCVLELLNSVPLMLLRRAKRLPEADGWRLMIDDWQTLRATLPVYLAAARREAFADLPEWTALEQTPSTTGHYFRGVD